MSRPDVEDEIIDLLKCNSRLSLGDLQVRSQYNSNEVRKSLMYLLQETDRVHVEGVDHKTKMYELT